MSIQSDYDCWSSTYDQDRNLTRDLDQTMTEQSLSNRRFENILELGCGTGKNTMLFSGIAKREVALDFSQGMIGLARQKANGNNIDFSIADLAQP